MLNKNKCLCSFVILSALLLFSVCDTGSSKYFTINFNAEGGKPAPVKQKVLKGCLIDEPEEMVKEGNDFDSWYKDAAYTQRWDFAHDVVTEDITLYAEWEPSGREIKGGSGGGGGGGGIRGTPAASVTISPSSVAFGSVTYEPLISPAASRTVTITNNNTTAVDVTGITLGGTNPVSFSLGGIIAPPPNINIAAGGSINFTVQPNTGLAAGTYSAIITVSYDTSSTLTVDMSITVGKIEMVSVPGGTFWLGYQGGSDRFANAREITMSSYKIGKYPITQGQWKEVMGAANNNSYFKGAALPPGLTNEDNLPVENVTWYDAVEFCNKLSENDHLDKVYTIDLRNPAAGYPIISATVTPHFNESGYRLPTEAQWEYAAKSGDNTKSSFLYSGSDIPSDVAWYDTHRDYAGTHEVGRLNPNGLGIYDMSGNVWEWCWEWYNGAFDTSTDTDPEGSTSGSSRAIRGGSWFDNVSNAYSASRGSNAPYNRESKIGFRVARP